MKSNLAQLLIRQSKWILLTFIILGVVSAYFAQRFRIDASAETLLVKDNQLYIQSQIMSQQFSPDEFILVAYKPKNHDLFSAKTFQQIEQLSEAFTNLPRVKSVTNILNVPLLSNASSLNADLDPNQYSWQSVKYSPQQMQQVFKDHPLFTDLLVNKEQTATAIQIVFEKNPQLVEIQNQIINIQKKALERELTEKEQEDVYELKAQADPIEQELKVQRKQEIDKIYEMTHDYQQDANFYLGGAYVLGQQMIDIIQRDLLLFGSAIGIAIVVMLFVLFRRIRWVVLPVISCGLSVLMTVGIFGLLDLRTTVISSNFIALQLILTLAVMIHLIVEYRQLAQKYNQDSQSQLLEKTLKNKFKPCLYAGLTTSVGFGSLLFSGIQPVVSFGWMMIVAMGISILVSLLLFPAFLSVLSHKDESGENRVTQFIIKGFTGLSLNYAKPIALFSLLLVAISVVGITRLDVENSFLNYFKESTQVRQELTFIDQEFGGSTPMDVVYTIPPEQQDQQLALTAESIQSLQKIQAVLTSFDAMGNVTSVFNFTELAMAINDNKPLTEYELTAIYTLLDESLKDKLLGAYFDPETNQLRISTRIKDSTKEFNRAEFLQDLKADMQTIGIDEQDYLVTNLFVLYQDILQRLFKSQILTLGFVFIALFLVLLAIFRSIKIALIAVIPNILTTLSILGVMGLLGIPLDLMTITISAIAMGIAVDDTIHFIHRYLEAGKNREAKENTASEHAIIATFNSVGYALLFTTTIITLGFALLSFSDFVPSILFGLLTGLAMLMALLTDSTLLPVLLKRFVKN
ncbi:MMPL family transporter [Aliiglaciecola sp. 3_MG-2023]|uniref:efflux RND transporter permease subunit n=1 Tax=Aliiglaciecola sp. 3_MG-2023 TaxID=3062644 RepID=UPI0026E2A12F|nr:MMPL family transporter [Aliiglaciecola sp. 3_MG-2023]MDO6694170.1 MMPL family transporter [Aliiglaciecola sp. 3_MG-2023]